ncbi:MAG: DNA primase [Planctomycetota bacterium]
MSTAPAIDGKTLVLDAVDLIDLVGRTVKLKRAGKDHTGLCPFHDEKTPSFYVVPDKKMFHCFGCKASGNAIDFVMKTQNLPFKEALHQLAEQYGIELPKYGDGRAQDETAAVRQACVAASKFFQQQLRTEAGKVAIDYLKSRGFTGEMARDFGLGFAPENGLRDALKTFKADTLEKAGLIKKSEHGSGYYDGFRNRLMFPIRDELGRPIAFGGRVLPGNPSKAKYLNSPETRLFEKRKTIYGLDRAKPHINRSRIVAVVEGYTDVVMCHQHGACNVVSVLGTALTAEHVQILRRFSDRVVLLFDADTAGQGATDRSIELFLTEEVEIGIATLPPGTDPDEFVKEHGADGFAALLERAQDPLDYHFDRLQKRLAADGSVTGSQRANAEYLDMIRKARGGKSVPVERWGPALVRIANRLGMSQTDVNRRLGIDAPAPQANPATAPKPAKREWLSREEFLRRKKTALQEVARPSEMPRQNAADVAAANMIGTVLAHPQFWETLQQHAGPADIADPILNQLAVRLWDHFGNEGEPEATEWANDLPDELRPTAFRLIAEAERRDRDGLDPKVTLNEAAAFFKEQRDRSERAKLTGQFRRVGSGSGSTDAEMSAKIDEAEALRALAEQASREDLRRIQ